MNEKYQLLLNGKVIGIVNPDSGCYLRIDVEPFLLEIKCSEKLEFHLGDYARLDCEITIKSISILDNISKSLMNKQK